MSDRYRELVYTSVLVMAVGLLWTVAWARDIGSRHDGYLPAANPRMVYVDDDEDDGQTVGVRCASGVVSPVTVVAAGR